MANYLIVLTRNAEKQLDKLSDTIAEPIFEKIQELAENPRPNGCKKLKGRSGYRIRVGNYRVIYELVDAELIIEVVTVTVGHRKDVY